MPVTTKILRKAAIKVEGTAGTYDAPNALLPFTSVQPKLELSQIEDESILGTSFKDTPLAGVRKATGSIACQAEAFVLEPMLEAAFGAVGSKIFTLPEAGNSKSISLCVLDAVKTNKYAGLYLNNFTLQSKAEAGLDWTTDLIGYVNEVRDDTSFPSISVNPGTRFLHQHLYAGSGYARLGDQADALAVGDNLTNLKDVMFKVNWNFAHDFVNSQDSLQPVSGGGGRPECDFTLQLASHSVDTYHAWRDAGTLLQAEFLYYASATAQLKIQVTNFKIIDVDVTQDDKARLDIKCKVGRNGRGTSYVNGNMTTTSPIRITLTNA